MGKDIRLYKITILFSLLKYFEVVKAELNRNSLIDHRLSCDFENNTDPYCNFEQKQTDDTDWSKEIVDQNTVLTFSSLSKSIGDVARLYGPEISLQETHCVKFRYAILPEKTKSRRDGIFDYNLSPTSSSVQLSIFVVEDTDWAFQNAIWSSSAPTTTSSSYWTNVELSLVPDKYHIVFDARVLSSNLYKILLDDVIVEKRRCHRSPHFLRLASLEMNRGESGSFNCKLADHDLIKYLPSSQIDSHIDAEMQSQFSDKKVQLRLEKSGGANLIRPDSMPVKLDNKHIEARFSFSPATDQISEKYRCVVRDDITAGVSNFAHLSVNSSNFSLLA
jgi:hypothetical protein